LEQVCPRVQWHEVNFLQYKIFLIPSLESIICFNPWQPKSLPGIPYRRFVHTKENNGQQLQQNLVWNLHKKLKRNNNEGKNLTRIVQING
jgi:hypothetical protein